MKNPIRELPRKRRYRVLMAGPQFVPIADYEYEQRAARRMRRALSAIANALAGDYLRGESDADYWRRFARELQQDARRALNGEG